MIYNPKLTYCTLVSLFVAFLVFPQKMQFIKDKEGILLLEDDQPRFFYQVKTKSKDGKFPRANYIHPLYGLDGEVLTEDFPDDHLHHHGIFWAWHQLYVGGNRVADPWLSEGISWKVEKVNTEIEGKKANLEAEVHWVQTSNGQAIIKENSSIFFERVNKDVFTLLFDIKLTALVDGVAIGGSEDAKGYGGFSARFILPEDVIFQSATGKVEPHNLPIQAGPWINLKAHFNPSGNNSSGIVIMGEPDELPSYQGWILRSANSMQNMAFPGSVPIPIEKGKSLEFRNQILIHRNLTIDEISVFYDRFAKEKGD